MVFGYPIYSIDSFFFKQGYTLQKVFCDSYSVSDSVLVTLAAAAAMSSDDKSTESMEITDIALNEKKIREKAKAILSIRTDIPPLPSSVKCIHENAAVIWEKCGSCVKLSRGKYHPKIILACFTKDNNETDYFYRIQVGSSNLTHSGAFETAVILEGTADAGEDNNSPNGSVLKEFYEMVFGSMKSISNELKALDKTNFAAPKMPDDYTLRSEIRNIRFAYTYPQKPNINNNTNSFSSVLRTEALKYPELHVYSPFMKFDNGKHYLSTQVFNGQSKPAITYYTNLTQEIFDNKGIIQETLFCARNSSPFLHAKIYIMKNSEEKEGENEEIFGRIWQGSANASAGGFENNVEFMVGADFKLTLPKNMARKDKFTQLNWIINDCSTTTIDSLESKIDPKAIQFKKANEWKRDNIFSDSDDTFSARGVVNSFTITVKEIPNDEIKVIITHECVMSSSIGSIECVSFFDRDENRLCVFPKPSGRKSRCYTVIDKQVLPVGGTIIAEVQLKNGNSLRVAVPITISGTISDIPEPESLMKLVKEWKCINVIPRCRFKQFSNPGDDVYRRLRACIASYGAAEKKTIYEKCCENIKKLCEALNQNNEPVYMNGEEKSYLKRLAEFLNCDAEVDMKNG